MGRRAGRANTRKVLQGTGLKKIHTSIKKIRHGLDGAVAKSWQGVRSANYGEKVYTKIP